MNKKGYTFTLTKQLILKTIWLEPGISRVELARRFNLNKSTITTTISFLQELGLVNEFEIGDAGPKGGRKPLGLEISNQFGHILGLEISTDSFSAVAINLKGEILYSLSDSLPPSKTLSQIIDFAYKKAKTLAYPGFPPLLALGIGIPGLINPEKGIIYYSGPLNISEEVLLDDIVSYLPGDIPIQIENDGNCGSWAELVYRKDDCPENFLYLSGSLRHKTIAGEGGIVPAVGFSIVMKRKILYGQNGTSGEFHSIYRSLGLPSRLSYSSDKSEVEFPVEQTLNEVIKETTFHVVFLMKMLNLDAAVIGHSFDTSHKKKLAESIKEEFVSDWHTHKSFPKQVVFSELDFYSVAYGAAARYLEEIFSADVINQNHSGYSLLQKLLK